MTIPKAFICGLTFLMIGIGFVADPVLEEEGVMDSESLDDRV